MSERRRRADAGQVRATERDALGMSWVVEQYGMPLDLLRKLLGTTDGATRQVLMRWRRAGWVETGQRGAGPSWVWATAAGIEAFGRHPYEPHTPSSARVAHHRAVVAVRLRIEDRWAEKAVTWRSEREMRWELGQYKGSDAQREHLADGEIDYDATSGARVRAGIEVELSQKPFGQLRSNMVAGLDKARTGYVQTWWFVNDRTRALVERAKAETSTPERVLIRELPSDGEVSR